MRFFMRYLMTHSMHYRLKASFTCSEQYRQQFKNPIAQLTISVGQPVHQGERLESLVRLVNSSFSGCKVMVDDSIQWYTLAIADRITPQQELIKTAIAKGDAYLLAHQSIFENHFTIPYEIIRWKDWLHTPVWYRAVAEMQQVYHTNPMLRQAVNNNVHTFLQRYEKTPRMNYNRAHAENMCTQYLIEECAVMKEYWVKLGCHYEIYPSGRNEAMSATHQLFIEPYHHLLLPIGVRYNRCKGESVFKPELPRRSLR